MKPALRHWLELRAAPVAGGTVSAPAAPRDPSPRSLAPAGPSTRWKLRLPWPLPTGVPTTRVGHAEAAPLRSHWAPECAPGGALPCGAPVSCRLDPWFRPPSAPTRDKLTDLTRLSPRGQVAGPREAGGPQADTPALS